MRCSVDPPGTPEKTWRVILKNLRQRDNQAVHLHLQLGWACWRSPGHKDGRAQSQLPNPWLNASIPQFDDATSAS
jgi:hypothetical protein